MSHPDINGRRDAFGLIVQLPADKASRDKCFAVRRAYYQSIGLGFAGEIKDSGQGYLRVLLR
jgi:hypothetical protein